MSAAEALVQVLQLLGCNADLLRQHRFVRVWVLVTGGAKQKVLNVLLVRQPRAVDHAEFADRHHQPVLPSSDGRVAGQDLCSLGVAERIGVQEGALSRYKLQVSDAVIGPLNDDGSVPHGTFRGWLPDTINDWNANRPGQGARTDITQPAHPRMAGPLLTP